MAPVRAKKRVSDRDAASAMNQQSATDHRIPTKAALTPQRSQIKKRKKGITLAQKQALIENLQLEITERARRLRAQYNLQAQSLRSRIEIRVNRIPVSLRRAKIGDLMQKYTEQQQRLLDATKPPPVPAKDFLPRISHQSSARPGTGRSLKRTSDDVASGDKENEGDIIDNPKKRLRGAPAAAADVEPAQVLSPTSSNARQAPRERASPAKSQIARPASPVKVVRPTVSSSLLASMVEKAKSTRATATRKTTTTSNTSSSSSGTVTATRTRRAAAGTATKPPATKRSTRRVSHTSDSSTSTVVQKPVAASATKRTVMGTIKKGVTGDTTKKTAAKAAATTSTRVLRKRG